jgi:heptosyltransferase-2
LSHLGNWELQAQIFPAVAGYVRNGTVFQPLGNRFIDKHVRELRGRAGVELFDRREGFHKVIELLRGGGAIGILSDQHAGDHGLWVPFFGRLASTSPLPALLTKRTHAALLGIAIYTDGRARWRMVFTDRIDAAGDSVGLLTAKANDLIAGQIRQAPEDWFWVHNRWKTPKPNFLLSKYKRGVLVPDVSAKDLKSFRILIRASNWLGDTVMSVPSVRVIKNGRPDTHITVAAPEKIASTWKIISEVDEIIYLTNRSLLGNICSIRRRPPFDVAIVFPNSLRSVLEIWFSGIPRRVGYPGHWRRWLLNQIVCQEGDPGPPEHQAKHYLRIAQDCGATTLIKDLDLVGRGCQVRRGEKVFTNASPGSACPLRLGLCPGADYGPAKRWLSERFTEVAVAVSAHLSVQWVLIGTKNDSAIGEKIAQALAGNCLNRIGQTTLEQLVNELRECRLLVTNDTGTMHLASLLGVPVVAIFGSTEPRLTGPLGEGNVIFRHHVECSPCFLRECPIDFRCMKAVGVPEVVDAILATLQSQQSQERP